MDKPIKDWTLSEAQDYCSIYRHNLPSGEFCEETDCELKRRGICHKDWVHDWNLDTFTQEEIDDANMIRRLFPYAISITRYTDSLVIRYNGDFLAYIDDSLFPSIKVGQTVDLSEV